MKGMVFDADGHSISFVNGSRVVSTTDGTLVLLLPTMHTFTGKVVTFPDFTKDQWYNWDWQMVWSAAAPPNGQTDLAEDAFIVVTAIAQEYDQIAQTLMAVPAGTDFIMAQMRLSRTSAPTHTWLGNSIGVLPPQNEWMPLAGGGSILMEAAIGMARAMHLEVKAGNLVLSAQQSVGQAALNDWVAYGDSWPAGNNTRDGGQNYYTSAPGLPIFDPNTASSRKHHTSNAQWPLTAGRTLQPGGSLQCTYTDVTNYASTYSVDVEVQFGRRS